MDQFTGSGQDVYPGALSHTGGVSSIPAEPLRRNGSGGQDLPADPDAVAVGGQLRPFAVLGPNLPGGPLGRLLGGGRIFTIPVARAGGPP
jgi:hypothetical protein